MKNNITKKRGRPRSIKKAGEIINIVRENPPESGIVYITIKKKWLNATEAAIFLDITKRHLYNLLKKGLPHKRKGSLYIFNVKDIDRWMIKTKRAQKIYRKEAFLIG